MQYIYIYIHITIPCNGNGILSVENVPKYVVLSLDDGQCPRLIGNYAIKMSSP